jgi:LasA protease
MIPRAKIGFVVSVAALLSSCGPRSPSSGFSESQTAVGVAPTVAEVARASTPIPYRPNYKPGELVDYVAQAGDTIPALAAHFNTTVAEIMGANSVIPRDATTMPPGFPMKIPIYYRSLWGNPFHILPDSAYVNGPPQTGFSTSAFVSAHPGWLRNYRAYAGQQDRSGAEIVDYIAQNYSISPRLLLAILEYKASALSQPNPPSKHYILDYPQPIFENAPNLSYLQLVWAANTLNNGYYGWRAGSLTQFDEPDGTIVRPDPWQDAATVALEYFFSRTSSGPAYDTAVGSSGFARTYQDLFGGAAVQDTPLIPGSLEQPQLLLPFPQRQIWTYTGGPHTGWGLGQPLSAIDFAPPCDHPGCASLSPQSYAVAMADGLVVRSGPDGLALDLDGDGNERTGWVIYYLHLAERTRAVVGQELHAGDPIGYPSSEGGEATGTHVHIARKYNGEWILADGPLGFNLDGWLVHDGASPYLGTMTYNGLTVTACTCSDLYSEIRANPQP